MKTGTARAFVPGAAAILLFAAACADPAREAPPLPENAIPAGTRLGEASVSGRVVYTGAVKPPEPINMASDAACHNASGGEGRREDLLVAADGGLRYAVVHIVSGLGDRVFAPPAEPVSLDQRGCLYRPRVVSLMVGQPLLLINSDPTLHNVHTISKANPPFNFGMSVQGQKATRYFRAPEVMIKARCDVHPWMASWIGVVAHPYHAVTGEDGSFSIEGLPAGSYEIEAWHETLGRQSRTLTLSDGSKERVEFSFASAGAPESAGR